jgi:hypothetical protein
MADFSYPTSDLDRPGALLNSIGSLWSSTYDGMNLVQSLLSAVAAVANQAQFDCRELTATVGRKTVPVLHTELTYPVIIKQSQLGSGYGMPLFDDGLHNFDDGTKFDTPDVVTASAYPAAAKLVEAPVIVNRLTQTSRTLIQGVDYRLADGLLIFRIDPFTDPMFAQREVFKDNQVVDRECILWVLQAKFDRNYVNELFAYVLSLQLPSTQAGKGLVNALLSALVDGSAQKHLELAWSAITGVPLSKSDGEIVQIVRYETSRLLIITDKNVYSFSSAANAIVAVGDTVNQYQPLTDALLFFEFNRGQVPPIEYVPGLSLSRGFLTAGFYADLIFRNVEVPIVVTYDNEGLAKVSFEIDGFPGDVELFFDEMHARGVASGHTLAHLLDTRPPAARDSEPDALSLPATINPLTFLCENVLRSNVILVRVSTAACLNGTGVETAKALRMLIPPQCGMIVLTELTYADEPIKMDGSGDTTAPDYLETVAPFLSNSFAESIDDSYFQETVRLFQVGGRCV